MTSPFAVLAFLGALACDLGAAPEADLPGGRDGEAEALLRENARQEDELFGRQEKTRLLRARLARAMLLDRYGDDCVARDPGPAGCLLTVEAFNRALEHRMVPLREEDAGFPTRADIEAGRGEVLRQILEEKYFAAAPLSARVRDSLSALAQAALRERYRTFRARLGDSTLRASYRALFPLAFRGREETIFEVLASTDSIRLDSLLASPDSALRRAWRAVPEGDLPAEALRAVRALAPGVLAGPVRVPFGYLLLREISRRRHPEVSMEEALPLLIAWSTRPLGGDSAWERDMQAYHRDHREEFTTPDTLSFRAWLLPGSGRKSLARGPDTATTRSLTVHERHLPPGLRDELSRYRPCRRGETLGPFRSVFGTWYLLVMEVRKGGLPMTLEASRPSLRKRLFGWERSDALAPILAEARANEEEIMTDITARYLQTRRPDDSSSGGAGKPGSALPWEEERSGWMRNHLILRFVELSDPRNRLGRAQ